MKASNISTILISGTIKELESKLGLDYVTLTGFLKGLEKAGVAQKSAKQRAGNQKGRSSIVWTINSSFLLEL